MGEGEEIHALGYGLGVKLVIVSTDSHHEMFKFLVHFSLRTNYTSSINVNWMKVRNERDGRDPREPVPYPRNSSRRLAKWDPFHFWIIQNAWY